MDYFFKEKPTQTWSSIIVPNSSLLPCCNHSILQCKPNNILINELQNPLAKKTFTVCSPQEAIVRIRLREQNDVTEPLVLSFSGATDWLKGWRETCRLITERNKAKQISIQNEVTHPGLFQWLARKEMSMEQKRIWRKMFFHLLTSVGQKILSPFEESNPRPQAQW